MHMNDILNENMDPTAQQEARWAIDCDGDDLDPSEHELIRPSSPEDTVDRLIDVTLEKFHQLQVTSKKDEHRRVLVVSTLHRLLLKKMQTLQEDLRMSDPEEPEMEDSEREAASLLNRILQEKICYLGYKRTVKLWVEPPRKPGSDATIVLPNKVTRNRKAAMNGEDEHQHQEINAAAPSERGPAAF